MVGNVADLVSEIAALRPWTMSWSNVVDYYKASEFHGIARACSIHGDTLHFAYSMNWSNNVSGSHLIDYAAADARQTLLQAGHEGMGKLYESLKWKDTFRFPPPENPMNIADFSLSVYHQKQWTTDWFKKAQLGGPFQVGNLESALWNPLTNTGSNTVLFTFTYDPDINFNMAGGQDTSLVEGSSTVDEIQEVVTFLKAEWQKGLMKGPDGLGSAAERAFHAQIPSQLAMLKKKLAEMQLQTSAGSSH